MRLYFKDIFITTLLEIRKKKLLKFGGTCNLNLKLINVAIVILKYN